MAAEFIDFLFGVFVWLRCVLIVPGELRQCVVLCEESTNYAVYHACCFVHVAMAAIIAGNEVLCLVVGECGVEIVRVKPRFAYQNLVELARR